MTDVIWVVRATNLMMMPDNLTGVNRTVRAASPKGNGQIGPCPLGTRNQSKRDFVCPKRSRRRGKLVLIHSVRGIKQVGLHLSGMKSRERRTCPHLFGTRNHVTGTSSVQYEVAHKENLSSFIRYEESSRWDFVRPERSRAKRELVLVRPV